MSCWGFIVFIGNDLWYAKAYSFPLQQLFLCKGVCCIPRSQVDKPSGRSVFYFLPNLKSHSDSHNPCFSSQLLMRWLDLNSIEPCRPGDLSNRFLQRCMFLVQGTSAGYSGGASFMSGPLSVYEIVIYAIYLTAAIDSKSAARLCPALHDTILTNLSVNPSVRVGTDQNRWEWS